MSAETASQTKQESPLLPFHESIISALIGAGGDWRVVHALGALIRITKIPKNHDEIGEAFTAALKGFTNQDDRGTLKHLANEKARMQALEDNKEP